MWTKSMGPSRGHLLKSSRNFVWSSNFQMCCGDEHHLYQKNVDREMKITPFMSSLAQKITEVLKFLQWEWRPIWGSGCWRCDDGTLSVNFWHAKFNQDVTFTAQLSQYFGIRLSETIISLILSWIFQIIIRTSWHPLPPLTAGTWRQNYE